VVIFVVRLRMDRGRVIVLERVTENREMIQKGGGKSERKI